MEEPEDNFDFEKEDKTPLEVGVIGVVEMVRALQKAGMTRWEALYYTAVWMALTLDQRGKMIRAGELMQSPVNVVAEEVVEVEEWLSQLLGKCVCNPVNIPSTLIWLNSMEATIARAKLSLLAIQGGTVKQ